MIVRQFIASRFEEYYSRWNPEMPREFKRREFAFVPLSSLPDFAMHRHVAFESVEEFKAHVLADLPAHIYYSSAYYERPGESSMEKKGWIGADLIFDIDADHLPVATNSVEVALKAAKRELKKLLVVLRKDFGISEDEMEVYFSGSRGYHVHVHSEDFLTLGSAERREIVDYLTANSPDLTANSNIAKRVAVYAAKRGISASDALEKLRIYIDAPVTADVKRLIRMPGSLHGKTGLRVARVDDVDEFDPMRDAIAFGEDEIAVRIVKRVKVRIGDCRIRARPGETIRVPEYAAIYLFCRGFATY